MPYARLVQAAARAREAKEREDREEWRRFAWLGWVHHIQRANSNRQIQFQEWLKMFGLDDESPKIIDVKKESELAEKNARDVMSAFERASCRKG